MVLKANKVENGQKQWSKQESGISGLHDDWTGKVECGCSV